MFFTRNKADGTACTTGDGNSGKCSGGSCTLLTGCRTDSDCPTTTTTTTLPLSCTQDAHCTDPAKPYCSPDNTCVECLSDVNCGYSPTTHVKGTCDTNSYTCIFGSCLSSNTNCDANFCCEGALPVSADRDVNNDGDVEDCVGIGNLAQPYLCS